MKIFFRAILVILFGVFWQNCSPIHEPFSEESESFNISSIYPYVEAPSYFDDVQIVEKIEDGGVWNYKFVATVVDANQEDTLLDVEVSVFDGQGKRVCPRVLATVNRTMNHIEVTECKSTNELSLLKVVLRAAETGGALKEISSKEFDLTQL